MSRGRLVLCTILLAGCLEPAQQQCASGLVCAPDKICDDVHRLCIDGAQRDACNGATDGDGCQYDIARGFCDQGICVPITCGDGVLDFGEVCDDGNLQSGDGCRADCRKLEMCGDVVVDTGEACDDGNANPSDGCDACRVTQWVATPLIGGAPNGTAIGLGYSQQIAIDRQGNVYIADTGNHRVRRVDATGIVTTIAGTGERGFSGDGGPATSARLNAPRGIAVDGLGNLYVSDSQNWRVRRVDPLGTIRTIAGTGFPGTSGDNIPAVTAPIQPGYVAVDGLGNVFFVDYGRIRRVGTNGVITTVAGNGTNGFSGDGGPATSASLQLPTGLALHGDSLYIADTYNQRIRRVDAVGTITTVAGNGTGGTSGDGGLATDAQLLGPTDVGFDAMDRMYIADSSNNRIRRVDITGTITTFAGTGAIGFSGDGGPALAAQLDGPTSLAIDASSVYVVDRGNLRVRRIDSTGTITTRVGSGAIGYTGEGQAATCPTLSYPYGIARDSAGNLYIAEAGHYRVRKVDPQGVITTVAGTGVYGYAGDGGPALAAQLTDAYDVAVDAAGNVYITELNSYRIRRVDPGGIITTYVGDGSAGASGDGGPATSARISGAFSLAVDGGGNLYIADTYNHRVRRVDVATHVITTVAGTGVSGYSGDGGPATSAQLWNPEGVTLDAQGNLYIADSYNNRVRRVDTNGVITTVAGNGSYGFSGDGGPATAAQLDEAFGLAFAPNGDLIIVDASNHRIRRVDGAGIITTIAGNGNATFSGDGGPATAARLQYPTDVAVDVNGRIYVADCYNHVVRRIDLGGRITTVAGQVDREDLGPVARARLTDPRGFVIAPAFTLFAAGGSGTVQALRSASGWLEAVAGRYPHGYETPGAARFRDANFGTVNGVAFDAAANVIYLTESNQIHAVTIVDVADAGTWTIAPLANASDVPGFSDGPVASAQLRAPSGLYLDAAAHTLYVADTGNHAIRAIDLAAGTVRTVAGTPATLGFAGDGGPATSALLYGPQAITRCANGDLFIADTLNDRVRRVAAVTNQMSTVLGDGVAGSSGEGAPSSTFPVNRPLGLACDAAGNLFVTSTTSVRLVAANAAGVADGTTAVTTIYGAAPRDTFPASVTRCLTGIAVTGASTLQVTDACTGILLELRREVVP